MVGFGGFLFGELCIFAIKVDSRERNITLMLNGNFSCPIELVVMLPPLKRIDRMKDLFKVDLIALKLKCGDFAKVGDVVCWNCFDSDDNTTWEFTGIYKGKIITYLGGGVDFGMGIGKELAVQDVIDEADNNDEYAQGVRKVGIAADVARCIAKIGLVT